MSVAASSSCAGQFLIVPVKKTWEVDLARPLSMFIASTYDNVNPNEYNHALNELNRLRIHYSTKINEKHESSLDVCYRYVDQLTAIEAKFPIAENQIRIAFKWQDAFGRRTQQLTSGAYERLCAIFNVGAVQTQVVDTLKVNTDEGLKMAAKFFQQASGVFSYLQTAVPTVVISGELTPDLWPETLGALSALSLAQAQDCFVRKAMADKMKPAVIAKLAQQCSGLYEEAQRLMTATDKVKSVWPRDWVATVTGKTESSRAVAEYHQAIFAKDSKNFGEQVARLRMAKECITRAEKQGSGSGMNPSLAKLISSDLVSAEKENGLIYNARVLDYKTLPVIEKATLAKQLPVNTPMLGTKFKDLFERIVPIPVQIALSSYENRKTEILQQEIGRLRAGTQALNGLLAALNLPAAIEDLSGGGSAVPQSLLVKAGAVRRAGGIDHLVRLTNELPTLLQCNRQMLDESDRVMNEEETSDRQLRSQFRQTWTRTPSESLNAPIRAEANRYRGIINNAVMADSKIKQRFAMHQEAIRLLSQTDTDIQRSLPATAGGGVGGSGAGLQGLPAVATLRQLMEQVQSLKQERDTLETQLKEAPCDMSSKFLTALAQDGAIYEEGLSVEQLDRVYGPLKESVSKSVQHQENLSEQIQRANTEFNNAKIAASGAGMMGAMSREQKLKQLASAYDVFIELKSNIEEGARFYNDLTQMLVRFQAKVNDFCFARKTEKDEYLKDLTSGLASGGGAMGGVPMSPTAGISYQLGSTQLMSSVNVYNPTLSSSAVFGSHTTMPVGGGSGYQGGNREMQFVCPTLPRGFNPYAQNLSGAATQAPTIGHGFNVGNRNR